jgi:hypothetical protein
VSAPRAIANAIRYSFQVGGPAMAPLNARPAAAGERRTGTIHYDSLADHRSAAIRRRCPASRSESATMVNVGLA